MLRGSHGAPSAIAALDLQPHSGGKLRSDFRAVARCRVQGDRSFHPRSHHCRPLRREERAVHPPRYAVTVADLTPVVIFCGNFEWNTPLGVDPLRGVIQRWADAHTTVFRLERHETGYRQPRFASFRCACSGSRCLQRIGGRWMVQETDAYKTQQSEACRACPPERRARQLNCTC